jgi:hypothetical protein
MYIYMLRSSNEVQTTHILVTLLLPKQLDLNAEPEIK